VASSLLRALPNPLLPFGPAQPLRALSPPRPSRDGSAEAGITGSSAADVAVAMSTAATARAREAEAARTGAVWAVLRDLAVACAALLRQHHTARRRAREFAERKRVWAAWTEVSGTQHRRTMKPSCTRENGSGKLLWAGFRVSSLLAVIVPESSAARLRKSGQSP